MNGLLRKSLALAAALMMSMSPVLAAGTSLGVYQTEDRKMDWGLDLCGDGTQLCITLLEARGTSATPAIKPWIGKLIVSGAKAAGKNKWKGKIRLGEHTLNGSLTLWPGEKLVMAGCAYVIICDEATLIPALP